jgi:hypothetical protein
MAGRHPIHFPSSVVRVGRRTRSSGSTFSGCSSSRRSEAVEPDVTRARRSRAEERHPEQDARHGTSRRAARGRGAAAPPRERHSPGHHRRPQSLGAQQPSTLLGDRLAPHDSREPQALPARVPHDHSRKAHRLRSQAQLAPRHNPVRRPEWVDGCLGGLLERVRCRARVASGCVDPPWCSTRRS